MKNKVNKVSFEFDKTLEQKQYQNLAEQFKNKGVVVCVVTNRSKYDNNNELLDTCFKLGIEKENIFFTEKDSKINIITKHVCITFFSIDNTHTTII